MVREGQGRDRSSSTEERKEMGKESMLARSCLMPCFLYLFEPKSVRPPHDTANAVGLASLPGININRYQHVPSGF